MIRIQAAIVGVAPILIGQIVGLAWIYLLVIALTSTFASLLLVAPEQTRHRMLFGLLASLSAGISISVPVIGIGEHFPVTQSSLLVQVLLWGPGVFAILNCYPGAILELRYGPVKWLCAVWLLGLATAPIGLTPVSSIITASSLLGVTFVAVISARNLGSTNSYLAIAAGIAGFVVISVLFAQPGHDWNWAIGEQSQTAWGYVRYAGLSAEPMHLGLIAGLATVLTIIAFRSRPDWPTWLLLGIGSLGLMGAVLGQSRAPLLGILAASLWHLVRTGSKRNRILIVGAIAIVLLVATMNRPEELLRREGASESLRSFGGRTTIWPIAIDAIADRPLLGYGAASSEAVFSAAIELDQTKATSVRNSHNRVLEIWITFGLVGLALTAVAIGSGLQSLHNKAAPKAESVLIYLFITGLTTPGSGSAFVDPLILALVVALVELGDNKPVKSNQVSRPIRMLREALGQPSQEVHHELRS